MTVGVVEVLSHLVVAVGILRRRYWAVIGGMVVSGVSLFATVPPVVTVILVPRSLRAMFSYTGVVEDPLLRLTAVTSGLAAVGYAVVLVLLVRVESAREHQR